MKHIGIMVIALALLFAGIAVADPGIEATRQISFIGENGAEITSIDNAFASECSPQFCNTVETGSSFTMSVVNTRTETNNRFVTASANTPLAINHNIRVDNLGDMPSVGKVSAFMKGMTQEGREYIEFSEQTSVDGQITLFEKVMHWESGARRV